jgi:hypothetical protein
MSWEVRERLPIIGVVMDGKTTIHKTEAISAKSDREHMEFHEAKRKEAETWLDENYPEWKDPFAYWDQLQLNQ